MSLQRKLYLAGACYSERAKWAGLTYAQAYRKAVRSPFAMGWFIMRVVAPEDYTNHEMIYTLGLRLQYGSKKSTLRRRAAGRRVIRAWAAKKHIEL